MRAELDMVMRLLSIGILALVIQASGKPSLLDPNAPEFSRRAPDVCVVRLETTKGPIDVEVTRAWSPHGADRFVALVRAGYYDNNRFFRMAPGDWYQFGINGDPAIARAWRRAEIPDDPLVQSNVKGTVAFAFAPFVKRTTQVFVNLKDNSPTHDKEPFTPFGKVIGDGMSVIDRLNTEHREGPGGIRAGRQDPFFDGGNTWLDEKFPRLDAIKRAVVIER
ncbi:MAG TPA: peptidylprolyl isomerase [Vicinamibacterales bacterium]|nr:peptidylprolyl isomerase [Vicinamibacterales bacterium]